MARNTLDIINISAVDDVANIVDCLIEVKLNESMPGIFLLVKETLSRIGVVTNQNTNTLYQTCHILCRGTKFYIVHFKHLYMLDGKFNGIKREDVLRMNRIARLLEQWGLVKMLHPQFVTECASMERIHIVKHHDLANWKLEPKYKLMNKQQDGNK